MVEKHVKKKSQPVATAAEENQVLLDNLEAISHELEIGDTDEVSSKGPDGESTPLPYFPTPEKPWDAEKSAEFVRQVRRFQKIATPPDLATEIDWESLTPALMFGLSDFRKIRHSFPLCIFVEGGDLRLVPLRQVMDEFATSTTVDDEGLSQQKRSLAQLEGILKELAMERGISSLDQIWQIAVSTLAARLQLKNQKREAFVQWTKELPYPSSRNALLVPYNKAAPSCILQAACLAICQNRYLALTEMVEDLKVQLKNLLAANPAAASEPAMPVDPIDASGTPVSDEIDIGALSHLLEESHLDTNDLTPARRHRLQEALDTLSSLEKIFFHNVLPQKIPLYTNIKALKKRHKEIAGRWLAFWKGMYIARLEVQNRYRPDVHDAFFNDFSAKLLSPEEWSQLPPLLLTITEKQLNATNYSEVIDLLAGDLPVKILLRIDDLVDSQNTTIEPVGLNFKARTLAKTTISLHRPFVLQTPMASIPDHTNEILNGISEPGPAIFSVYSAIQETVHRQRAAFLTSTAAAEARVFPAFVHNPAAGNHLARQFDLSKTSGAADSWQMASLSYQKDDGKTSDQQLAFTAADFLAGDPRFARRFTALPTELIAEAIIPLSDYLELSEREAISRIPYLIMAEESGRLMRIVPDDSMIRTIKAIMREWCYLQELGGFHNSHAAAALAREKEKLQTSAMRQVEELRSQHEAEMNLTVEKLGSEIISRIAAGLLTENMLPQTVPPQESPQSIPETPAPAPSSRETEETPPAALEPPTETEAGLVLEDPYIDSTLCTSCNDCTAINNRMFAYNENKQAYIKDASAGTFRQLVEAAEKCPVKIIHPGRPSNPDEPDLDALTKRAEKFN